MDRFAPSIGIVLVNYNGMHFLPDCLDSLNRLEYSHIHIVVVDNASTDGSPAWTREHYPNVILIQLNENRGVTGGNNTGITWCCDHGCDYILLLNNDTVVEPDFLGHLLRHADDQTLVVPRVYFHDNRNLLNSHFGHFDFWRGVNVQYFYGRSDSPTSRSPQMATMASTCAMLIPTSMFERIGLMDEQYFLYYDDTDFITRAVNQGAAVKYVPEAIIYHRESSSSGGWQTSSLSMYYNTRNRLYFMFKHQSHRRALIFFLVYFSLGRIVLWLRYQIRGNRQMATALKNGVIDFRRGRMGAASIQRYQ